MIHWRTDVFVNPHRPVPLAVVSHSGALSYSDGQYDSLALVRKAETNPDIFDGVASLMWVRAVAGLVVLLFCFRGHDECSTNANTRVP
jgi:16S rRNA C1402 (ribose-2'-O) methylase RsmI